MAGYLIANLSIHDPKAFEEYRNQVAPLIGRFKGRYLVRGGELQILEGNPNFKRLVVLEFPSSPTPSSSTTAPNTRRSVSFDLRARKRMSCWRTAIPVSGKRSAMWSHRALSTPASLAP